MRARALPASLISAFTLSILLASGGSARTDTGTAERVDQLMQRYHSHRHFHGAVLVAEEGGIIYSKAFGAANIENDIPNTLTTRFGLASMSKQFTSMLVLQLVQEGKLRLDGPVTDYLPEYPGEPGDRITIHQLLTHTSGIYQDSPTEGPRASRRLEPHSRAELMRYFSGHELLFEPGAGFQYSNFNYNLLAIIAEAVTGKPYEALLRERIFDPLGMKNTCVGVKSGPGSIAATGYDYDFLRDPRPVDVTHESVSIGAGDLYSTVQDLFRWDQALYTDALLSERYREMLFTPHTNVGYAYGWQVRAYPVNDSGDSATAIYHDGGSEGTQCCIYRFVDDGKLFVLLSNHREPWIHIRLSRPKEDIAPDIIRALYGGEYELPARSAAYETALAAEDSGAAAIGPEYERLYSLPSDDYTFDADEFYNVGLCYLWRSENEKAYEFLKIAVEDIGIDHLGYAWQCYAVYGEAAFKCGRAEEAIRALEKSLELNPGNASASYWLNMARMLEKSRG
jgi:CubicO group peptidase (beta-lactamase class C family)